MVHAVVSQCECGEGLTATRPRTGAPICLPQSSELGMPEASKPGKSVYVRMGVWWDPDHGHIHLTAPGVHGFHSTLNDTPGSKRCHENLFRKLAKLLRDEGAPHPAITDASDADRT